MLSVLSLSENKPTVPNDTKYREFCFFTQVEHEHRGKVAIGLPHSDWVGVKKKPFQLCFTTLALNTYVLSTYLGSSQKNLPSK